MSYAEPHEEDFEQKLHEIESRLNENQPDLIKEIEALVEIRNHLGELMQSLSALTTNKQYE